ncbi:unnamed protein product, partial [Closterium sp. NIES-54]
GRVKAMTEAAEAATSGGAATGWEAEGELAAGTAAASGGDSASPRVTGPAVTLLPEIHGRVEEQERAAEATDVTVPAPQAQTAVTSDAAVKADVGPVEGGAMVRAGSAEMPAAAVGADTQGRRPAEPPSRRPAEPTSRRADTPPSRRPAEPTRRRPTDDPAPPREPPSSRTAEPPSSRAARQPSRPAAEPPDSRAAEPPCSRAANAPTESPRPYLLGLCDKADGLSLFDLTSGASPAPPATADSTVRSQWATRDAAACLAVHHHLPTTERAHFSQYKSAQTLYDAVVVHYSSPATAGLSRLMLPYLFLDLAAFPTVADLITHLRTSGTRYHVRKLKREMID